MTCLRSWFQLLASFALIAGACASQADDRRPNILFAMADDWGWPHAGAYGDAIVKTPTFDRLCREGVRFEHAYVSSPSCTPSRNAILTGQDFYRLGEGANLHSTLDVRHPTFVRLLQDHGYRVGHWRKAWGPGDAKAGGYTSSPCGPSSTFTKFLKEPSDGQPFCFWFGTSDPHRGYKRHSGREAGIDPSKVQVPAFLPNNADVRGDIADYYFEVQRWDHEVGEALALLEERGELDNTIVVMTGDHGMPFPRCKGNLYDWGVRVPLAARWGSEVGTDRKVSSFVSLTDLAPTFLEAAGVTVPEVMTGVSLLPILTGDTKAARAFVTFGRERHTPAQKMPSLDGYPSRAIRKDDWLLILNLKPDRWPAGVPEGASHPMNIHSDCDNGPTKSRIVADQSAMAGARLYQLCFGKRPAVELYNTRVDPDQVTNLALDPKHRSRITNLQNILVKYLQRNRDPRFVRAGKAPFDSYPYRAGYLQKHLQKHGHR